VAAGGIFNNRVIANLKTSLHVHINHNTVRVRLCVAARRGDSDAAEEDNASGD